MDEHQIADSIRLLAKQLEAVSENVRLIREALERQEQSRRDAIEEVAKEAARYR